MKRNRDGRADSTIANINVEVHVRGRVIEGRWRGCEWRKQGAKGRSAEGRGGRVREKFDLSAITIGDWTLTGSCASCGDA